MKKHMLCAAAAACAAAFAVPAQAADVSVYGVIDTGFTYSHISDAGEDKLEMNSGNYAGPRVGLKGQEDLGNGLKVGFILESGFSSDTGTLGQNGGIFGREAQLNVSGSFGTIGMGRVGAFSSGSSSLGWYWDMEPFETGYTDAGVQATQVNVWRLNSNTIYYVSPTIAGAKLGLQYSFTGTKDKESPEFSDNDGFFNAALRWDGADARALFGFEYERFGTKVSEDAVRRDNAVNFKLAGAYNPGKGPFTAYLGVSYYKNYNKFSDSTWDDDGSVGYDMSKRRRLEGWSAFVGGKYTVGRADLLASVQYLDGENKNPEVGSALDADYSRIVGAVGCHYHFSNRTMLYGILSYADGSGTFDDFDPANTNRTVAHLGMTHFF